MRLVRDLPQSGDVLISKQSASVAHEVLVVPFSEGRMFPNHDLAAAEANRLAETTRVDVWITEDHIHFLRVAAYRAPSPQPAIGGEHPAAEPRSESR